MSDTWRPSPALIFVFALLVFILIVVPIIFLAQLVHIILHTLPANDLGIIDMTDFAHQNRTTPSISDIHFACRPPEPSGDSNV